ncbi:MAG TPA: hypothetical protein VMI09_02780 [Candidatus Binataceae bacterium]|nr:hypothetical protein [Candidatus Binataceae bacterium]
MQLPFNGENGKLNGSLRNQSEALAFALFSEDAALELFSDELDDSEFVEEPLAPLLPDSADLLPDTSAGLELPDRA